MLIQTKSSKNLFTWEIGATEGVGATVDGVVWVIGVVVATWEGAVDRGTCGAVGAIVDGVEDEAIKAGVEETGVGVAPTVTGVDVVTAVVSVDIMDVIRCCCCCWKI